MKINGEKTLILTRDSTLTETWSNISSDKKLKSKVLIKYFWHKHQATLQNKVAVSPNYGYFKCLLTEAKFLFQNQLLICNKTLIRQMESIECSKLDISILKDYAWPRFVPKLRKKRCSTPKIMEEVSEEEGAAEQEERVIEGEANVAMEREDCEGIVNDDRVAYETVAKEEEVGAVVDRGEYEVKDNEEGEVEGTVVCKEVLTEVEEVEDISYLIIFHTPPVLRRDNTDELNVHNQPGFITFDSMVNNPEHNGVEQNCNEENSQSLSDLITFESIRDNSAFESITYNSEHNVVDQNCNEENDQSNLPTSTPLTYNPPSILQFDEDMDIEKTVFSLPICNYDDNNFKLKSNRRYSNQQKEKKIFKRNEQKKIKVMTKFLRRDI